MAPRYPFFWHFLLSCSVPVNITFSPPFYVLYVYGVCLFSLLLVFFSLHLFTMFLKFRLSRAFTCGLVVELYTGSSLLFPATEERASYDTLHIARNWSLIFSTLATENHQTRMGTVCRCCGYLSGAVHHHLTTSSMFSRWFFKHYIGIFRWFSWETWHRYWKWKFSFLLIFYMVIFTTLRNENIT